MLPESPESSSQPPEQTVELAAASPFAPGTASAAASAGASAGRWPRSRLRSDGSRWPSLPAPQRADHPSGSVCKGRSPPVVWGTPEPRSAGSCCISLVPQMVQNLVFLLLLNPLQEATKDRKGVSNFFQPHLPFLGPVSMI